MLLIFFSVRGLVENSYGLFSIDFIFGNIKYFYYRKFIQQINEFKNFIELKFNFLFY